MKINKKLAIAIAKQATDLDIKPKHYRRGMAALNALYFALQIADNQE